MSCDFLISAHAPMSLSYPPPGRSAQNFKSGVGGRDDPGIICSRMRKIFRVTYIQSKCPEDIS